MRIVGSMPDDEEDKLEILYAAKIFVVGLKVKELAQEARRQNDTRRFSS